MKRVNLNKLKLNQKIKITFLNGDARIARVIKENETFGITVKFKYNNKILTRVIGTTFFSKDRFHTLSPDKRSYYQVKLEVI